MASAQTLLYGRRNSGQGPSTTPASARPRFHDLRTALRQGELPDWLLRRCPDLSLYRPAEDEDYEGLASGESYTHGYLKGLNDNPVEISMVIDCGRKLLALDYDDTLEYSPIMASAQERKLLKTIANNLADEVTVELTACDSNQIDQIINAYPDQLSVTLSDHSHDYDDQDTFAVWAEDENLTAKHRELFKKYDNLTDLLADTNGRAALEGVIAYHGMITFRRPLPAFA